VDSAELDQVIVALSKLPNIEEIYEVAGEYDIVSLVSTSCMEELREVLQKGIMKIKGVKSTITTIVMQSHKGPKCLAKESEKEESLLK